MRVMLPLVILPVVMICFWLSSTDAHAQSASQHHGVSLPVQAIAAEMRDDNGITRMEVTLSRSVAAGAFVMENPDRVIVELPETAFVLPKSNKLSSTDIVRSVRYGVFAPSRSRLVLELSQPARITKVDVISAPDQTARLVVELEREERGAFQQAASSGMIVGDIVTAALKDHTTARNVQESRPVIVIDPGHGGVDVGARTSRGQNEKDIVFAFARHLRHVLGSTGRYKVLMTREKDVFVSLDQRVIFARSNKADLLISIHADSIASEEQVRGLTVYTRAARASDADSAELALRENMADMKAGLSDTQSQDDVSDILQDLMVRETRGLSRSFSGKLVSQLKPAVKLNVNPEREAAFKVLKAPDIPSVLVELGYLSSRKDSALLTSEEWRKETTASMVQAVDRFFSNRTAVVSP
jgi:N-acetylmuramoyl-L-alanine amidase